MFICICITILVPQPVSSIMATVTSTTDIGVYNIVVEWEVSINILQSNSLSESKFQEVTTLFRLSDHNLTIIMYLQTWLQSNLSNLDTLGPSKTVLIIEVSLFLSVHNSRFDCTCTKLWLHPDITNENHDRSTYHSLFIFSIATSTIKSSSCSLL